MIYTAELKPGPIQVRDGEIDTRCFQVMASDPVLGQAAEVSWELIALVPLKPGLRSNTDAMITAQKVADALAVFDALQEAASSGLLYDLEEYFTADGRTVREVLS